MEKSKDAYVALHRTPMSLSIITYRGTAHVNAAKKRLDFAIAHAIIMWGVCPAISIKC